MSRKKILLLDTSNNTENMGDFIIMDSVQKQLRKIFPDDFFINASTHETIGKKTHEWHREAAYTFLGGTNLLSGRYIGKNRAQWRFGFTDSKYINDVIGLAVGWQSDRKYTRTKDIPFVFAQKKLYKNSMNDKILHSVRDSFTQKRMLEYGIGSINTACVTMWDLTPEHLQNIKQTKSSTVVMTLTDYRRDQEFLESYRDMLLILIKNYQQIFLWVQSAADIDLLAELGFAEEDRIMLLSPTLQALDNVLNKEDIDYVGTRLHAGIRALQHGRRTVVIEVDNRAREIARDTNLKTLNYQNISKLDALINSTFDMDIHVPFDQIERWKSQFISEI
ncbi:polysaccharide pyruvyl transferase family protein [uncultured Leuconostoc sp.]|jgi:hypothetical protein|uniref:polysaccharide pyruvyl transferase family protein n=1 Tax=uncultured Leuconostoc sp. TaxID=173262 RepID=UPI00280463E2|nr:polysaccharide pyruvyl transferase family protein [uncultured Leuconostoc sp.]